MTCDIIVSNDRTVWGETLLDINNLLRGVECACGKTHTCDIRHVYIEHNAVSRLCEICEPFEHILLVADGNTFAAAGKQTLDALDAKQVETVIFDGNVILVPNENAIHAVTERLQGIDLIVGVGSGVIQDLCKFVSFASGVPYLVVATAPSMDGYASSGAAMITDGMKVTYPAGLPLAIVADTEVLANAPMEMIVAGYGDIVGKFSALNDWKLSKSVCGEYFCDYIYDLTYEQIQKTLALADGIMRRDELSVQTLMEALVTVGILMSFAGSSRPASGSEHHLSHFFEITGILNGTYYFPHGIDVAYSTYVTAKLRETILARGCQNNLFRLPGKQYETVIKSIYTSVADGCIALQKKVGNYDTDRTETYRQKETEIRQILAEMPTSDEIARMLLTVGLKMDKFFAQYGGKHIRDAVLYAKDLKDRYTVLWLYYDLFGGETPLP